MNHDPLSTTTTTNSFHPPNTPHIHTHTPPAHHSICQNKPPFEIVPPPKPHTDQSDLHNHLPLLLRIPHDVSNSTLPPPLLKRNSIPPPPLIKQKSSPPPPLLNPKTDSNKKRIDYKNTTKLKLVKKISPKIKKSKLKSTTMKPITQFFTPNKTPYKVTHTNTTITTTGPIHTHTQSIHTTTTTHNTTHHETKLFLPVCSSTSQPGEVPDAEFPSSLEIDATCPGSRSIPQCEIFPNQSYVFQQSSYIQNVPGMELNLFGVEEGKPTT